MEIDVTKIIYDKMRSHQFLMCVLGSFEQEMLRAFIKMTETKLLSLETDETIKRKIFHFVVECAQNLCNNDVSDENSKNNLFLIGKNEQHYFINLGSIYSSAESQRIRNVIDEVNSLEEGEVRSSFYQGLSSTEVMHNNQLLMSALHIAKRSKEKICYEVVSIDKDHDFLSFNTIV